MYNNQNFPLNRIHPNPHPQHHTLHPSPLMGRAAFSISALCYNSRKGASQPMEHKHNHAANEETHMDPFGGMSVPPATAAGSHEYKTKTYYFCGPGCLHQFKKDPEKYLAPNYKPS